MLVRVVTKLIVSRIPIKIPSLAGCTMLWVSRLRIPTLMPTSRHAKVVIAYEYVEYGCKLVSY